MRTFYFLIAQSLFFCCFQTFGQNYPVYNSYPVNLYLYNPAEAASDYAYLFINHRQQWTGIEGAPQLSTINFNTLLDQTRLGIGAKISSYKRGLLSTTDVQGTLAYGIPLNKADAIYFGMSGGMISNSIDQSKIIDPTDPAIANYLANNLRPAASAGFMYKSGSGINLGFSLPQFISQPFSTDKVAATSAFTPLNQVIVSAYYKKKVEGKFVGKTVKGMRTRVKSHGYAPLEFYAVYKYSAYQTNQFEVSARLNLSENIALGAGYRQSYGVIASAGFTLKKFLLNYSFEPGSQPASGFSSGTHEIQIGIRLGSEKKLKRDAPVLRSALKAPTVVGGGTRLKHSISDPEEEERMEQMKDTSKKKYLVVIRDFSDFSQAEDFKKKLIEQKFNADIYFYQKDKKYYVHVLQALKSQEANEEVRNLKAYTKLKDAHVVVIDERK